MPARKKKDKPAGPARDLLDAHVAFVLEQLDPTALDPWLARWLDLLLDQAGDLRLDQVMTPELIKDTARTYAVELVPGPGIPELIGEIARRLHEHPVHEQTRLGDLLAPDRFDDLLRYALALKSIRDRLVRGVLASPLYERIASELLYHGIRDYLARNTAAAQNLPGARSALRLGRAVVGLAGGGIERAVEEGLKQHIARSLSAVSKKTAQPLLDGEHDDDLFEVISDTWRELAPTRMAELRDDLDALDLEELLVTLYEHWKELRQTPFIGRMIDAGIDGFFAKYAAVPLLALLEDLGLDRAQLLGEARRFAPEVLARLRAEQRLEPLVRGLLAPFYASGRVEAVLGAA